MLKNALLHPSCPKSPPTPMRVYFSPLEATSESLPRTAVVAAAVWLQADVALNPEIWILHLSRHETVNDIKTMHANGIIINYSETPIHLHPEVMQ